MDEFKVSVVSFGDNRPLMLRWIDPATRQRRFKSAKTRKRREAERMAALLEKELREGKYAASSRMAWSDFAFRFTEQVLPGRAPKTRLMFETVFTTIERLVKPQRLADMNAARLSEFAAGLRNEGKAEATVKTYLAHLRASLMWAARLKMLPAVPEFPETIRAPKAGGPMKGRPITGEELWKMLRVTRRVVGPRVAKHFRRLLVGLWWSGLRLGEAVDLRWDGVERGLVVDMTGRRPMLRIDAEHEKGNRSRLLPLAPEFCGFLGRTPPARRRGRVFHLPHPKTGRALASDEVSRIVCTIGRLAGIKVNSKLRYDKAAKQRKETPKFASAHDLRRSFGARWSVRVMPRVLMELMRHESIDTTMKYYVGRNAEATSDAAFAAYEATRAKQTGDGKAGPVNTSVNSRPPVALDGRPRNDTSPCFARACEVEDIGLEPTTF